MYNIIQKRRWLFGFSVIILVPGLWALIQFGLKLGIDFTGGTRLVATFSDHRPVASEAGQLISDLGFGNASAQTVGTSDLVFRLPPITNDQRQKIIDQLTETYGAVTEQSFDSIGPTLGRELLRRAWIALALVLVAIIVYISLAFRKVNVGPVPAWMYGLAAIVALAHDVLLVIGVFALLGHYQGAEIDSLFVTALLTVLGFSVHDSIVVFDRIRERLLVGGADTYEGTVNQSLNLTLVRSLNTSITTMIVLAVLYLFGGATIKTFTLALLIGIASGTYSSIFVASPLLVVYEQWRRRKR